MNRALQKIEAMQEKPVFIDRSLLESLLKPVDIEEKGQKQRSNKISNKEVIPKQNQVTNKKSVFHPYAKDIEAEIKIIEDSTDKLSSNGNIEEYLKYFQDRFRRIERLLRRRIDARASTPLLEALKSPPKTKLKIICMVAEKRESKQQIILKVEDLQSSATILVTARAPEELHKKAQLLLPDQVVCIAVIKTRGRLFLAEDIIFPDVGQKPPHRASEPVYAVLTSDLHVGSSKFNRESFNRFILWLNGEYGNERMKQIAGGVKYLLIAGDLVDGVGVYPNQINELDIKDIHKQYELVTKLIEQIPEYIEIIISPGNHDASRKALPQPSISDEFLKNLSDSRRIYSLGNPALVSLHTVEVLMYHGRSLDDIIAAVPRLNHKCPERAMRLLLQGRHLAPLYGGKTMLVPENRDFLVIEHLPDIFHAGHVHVMGFCSYRGVLIVNSGGWQDQTEYMQKLGVVPTPGLVPVVNLQTLESTSLSFL
jgi:DNA polymerase II small subunit